MTPDETRNGTGAAPRLRLALATVLGLGSTPVAPGTAGSMAGLVLVWVLWQLAGPVAVAAGAVVVSAVGIWAAEGTARHLGEEDPSRVVIDEVAGQMVALVWLPPTVPVLAAGFLLFRLFDIMKPFPVRRLEKLPGGLGIVADDLAAGLYSVLLLHVGALLFPALLDGI